MKTKILGMCAIGLLAQQVYASVIISGDDGGCEGDAIGCTLFMCAPEVKEGNLKATDRVLQNLAQNQLKDAVKFQVIVKNGTAISGNKKIKFYMDQIGIQSDEDLVAFVGGREVDAVYITTLAKNADLTPSQSALVLQSLSQALLGGIK